MRKAQRWVAAVTLWVAGIVCLNNGMSNGWTEWTVAGVVLIGAGVFMLFLKSRAEKEKEEKKKVNW